MCADHLAVLAAAQQGQQRLHTTITQRLQREVAQQEQGKQVSRFSREETRTLAYAHNAFEDLLISYHRLLRESATCLEQVRALHHGLFLLDQAGLLPPSQGPQATWITTVQHAIERISVQWQHWRVGNSPQGQHEQV